MTTILGIREALLLVLDQVDYTRHACRPDEMVGAVLPREVIDIARAALERAQEKGNANP